MMQKLKNSAAYTALGLAALGFVSGIALANDHDEIIVTGQFLSIDKLNAVKTPTPIINVPQSLSIISVEQISDQSFTSIGDILQYTPGLSVSQGEGHRDAIIIRGNQSTADFFQDGIRDDVQYFRPLYNVQQVEILRGSNALLFGRGGGGGVINRVSKTPDTHHDFTSFAASVDTFGAFAVSGDYNHALGKEAGLRVNGFVEGLNNHRDFVDGTRFGVNPTLRAALDNKTLVDVSYEYLDDDRVVDRGVPSVSVDGGPDVPLEGYDETFFGSAEENRTTLQAHIVKAHIDHEFSENLRGNATAQYADYDKFYQNIYAAGFDDVENEIKLDGYQDATARQNLILQGNLVGEYDLGSMTHTILVGAEYGRQDTENARIDNVFAESQDDQIMVNFADPLIVPDFAFSNPARDRQSDVTTTSFYIQDQIDLTDWVKVVLGGRYDRFDIEVFDRIEASDGDNVDGKFNRQDEEITPRLGLILKPQDNVSIYASYSETFLPRSGEQFLTLNLDNEGTKPQFFENREIGAKWNIRPKLSLTAALFELSQESFTTIAPSDPSQLQIVAGSKTNGVEFQLSGEITDKWYLSGGYSYLDGQVKGGSTDGNKTRQTPENMFSLWNRYDVNENLGFGLGVTHQSSFFVREDNAVKVPGYTRFDASAYYTLSETLRIQMNLENLLNADYYSDAHSNDNISTGRPFNARFSIQGDF